VTTTSSRDRKVRIAIVGLGFGAEFIPIHQRHPHAELVAICQRSREKLDQIGKAFGVERRYERYADLLAQQGAQVVLECQAPLKRTLAGCLGVEAVISPGQAPPSHDYHTSLLSLPATLRTTLPTLPAARPYLGVESEAVEHWRTRLSESSSIRVGVCLPLMRTLLPSGQSPTLRQFLKRLPPHPDVALFDMSRLIEPGQSTITRLSASPATAAQSIELRPAPTHDHWVEVSAILRNLDLLIATDDLLAHLAGAIGVPTWILLPISPEPRWMLRRDDSPWYPTAKLWRQTHRDDWDDVAIRVGVALSQMIQKANRSIPSAP
jgi:hypothetical protein